MKNLIFSLTFVFLSVFSQKITLAADVPAGMDEWLKNAQANPSTTTSTEKFVPPGTVTPSLDENDFSKQKPGQTIDEYWLSIQNENKRRQNLGLKPLPGTEIISTTQIPANNGKIIDPIDPELQKRNREIIMEGINNRQKTQDSPKTSTPISNSIIDKIIPSSLFGNMPPLGKVLNQLFYLGLVVAVVLAIVMIIRGGVEYMTVDAIYSKESGKNRIKAALGGLLLAFSTILILNTINPSLTSLNLVFPTLKGLQESMINGGLISGTRGNTTIYDSINNSITPTSEGYTVTPNRVAIDTDGTERPPFADPDWQGQTSMMGLNANVDNYVVVPTGSTIPLGTKVQMYNSNTGKTAWGVVGDRGPSPNGFGEISLHAAKELGAWSDGMGNSANQHNITYTYYTNEK